MNLKMMLMQKCPSLLILLLFSSKLHYYQNINMVEQKQNKGDADKFEI
jgi:hypothetical protein